MNLHPHEIIVRPIVSEESQIQVVKANQYTFQVNPKANKRQIADALEHIFKKDKIQVVRVNTMNYEGKPKRVMGRMRTGKKPDWKKAIVTLRDGDKIELI